MQQVRILVNPLSNSLAALVLCLSLVPRPSHHPVFNHSLGRWEGLGTRLVVPQPRERNVTGHSIKAKGLILATGMEASIPVSSIT